MTTGSTENHNATEPLTDEQRAAAFTETNSQVGHDGLARVGRPPIPRKFVLIATAVIVVLGLGGQLVEHYFGGIGTTGTTTTTVPNVIPSSGPQIHTSLQTFMGLKEMGDTPASPIALLDQSGAVWNSSAQRGKVVVLTFLNKDCEDICPVVGAEIKLAKQQLGAMSAQVEFVIVNADPKNVQRSSSPRALSVTHLLHERGVFFITGTVRQLNSIWIHYGLSVRVGRLANQVVHNNLMYFIDAQGKLRWLAVPVANEQRNGSYALAGADIRRFANGIVTEAISLAK